MTTSNATRVFHVSTSAGFTLWTTIAADALAALESQLRHYGYPMVVVGKPDRGAAAFLRDLAEAIDGIRPDGPQWFYGHVSITVEERDAAMAGMVILADAVVAVPLDDADGYRAARVALAEAVEVYCATVPAVMPEGAVHAFDAHRLYADLLDAAHRRVIGRLECTTSHGSMLCCGISCAMSSFCRAEEMPSKA